MPGEQTTLQAEVLNTGKLVNHFTLQIERLPREWVTIEMGKVQLLPGKQAALTASIQVPRQSNSRTGKYPFVVQILEQTTNKVVAATAGTLEVGLFHGFATDLQPRQLQRSGTITLQITNTGNTVGRYLINARDQEGALNIHVAQGSVMIEAGQSQQIAIQISPRHALPLEHARMYPFELTISSEEGQRRIETGHLTVTPTAKPLDPVKSVPPTAARSPAVTTRSLTNFALGCSCVMPILALVFAAGVFIVNLLTNRVVDAPTPNVATSTSRQADTTNPMVLVGTPRADILDVQTRHHILDDDNVEGMQIIVRLTLDNAVGIRCSVGAYFYDAETNEPLVDLDERFDTEDGYVYVGEDFTPQEISASYAPLVLFIPYEQFHLDAGVTYQLAFQVRVYRRDTNEEFATRDETFTYPAP
jgi:hypothetical protein